MAHTMWQKGIRRIFVVDNKQRAIGVITQLDIFTELVRYKLDFDQRDVILHHYTTVFVASHMMMIDAIACPIGC